MVAQMNLSHASAPAYLGRTHGDHGERGEERRRCEVSESWGDVWRSESSAQICCCLVLPSGRNVSSAVDYFRGSAKSRPLLAKCSPSVVESLQPQGTGFDGSETIITINGSIFCNTGKAIIINSAQLKFAGLIWLSARSAS